MNVLRRGQDPCAPVLVYSISFDLHKNYTTYANKQSSYKTRISTRRKSSLAFKTGDASNPESTKAATVANGLFYDQKQGSPENTKSISIHITNNAQQRENPFHQDGGIITVQLQRYQEPVA